MDRHTLAMLFIAGVAVTHSGRAQQPIEVALPPTVSHSGVRLIGLQSQVEELPRAAPAAGPSDKLPFPLPSLSQEEVERLPQVDEGTGKPSVWDAPDASTEKLTLDELISIALSKNPTLAQAQARVQAAQGAWQQAGRPRNPRIGYQGTEIGNEGRSGLQGGFVAQEFTTGRKLALAQAVAGQQVAQAQQEYEAQRLRVISDVRGLYYQALVADQQAQAFFEFQSRLQKVHEHYRQLQEQGEISAPDEIIFDYGGQLPFHLGFSNAPETRRNLRRQLSAVIGAPQLEIGQLEGDPSRGWPEYDWHAALERTLALSPQLAAARAGAARASAAVALQRRMVVPNVDLELGLQHDNATADDVANVQIGLPIPLFDRNQGAIRQAEAQFVAAQANVSRIELGLQRRLAEVFDRYSRSKKQAEKLGVQVQHIERAFARRQDAVDAGEYSALENLVAQRTYFEIWAGYLDSLRELWSSVVAIDGLLLSGSLDVSGSDAEEPSGVPNVGGVRR